MLPARQLRYLRWDRWIPIVLHLSDVAVVGDDDDDDIEYSVVVASGLVLFLGMGAHARRLKHDEYKSQCVLR